MVAAACQAETTVMPGAVLAAAGWVGGVVSGEPLLDPPPHAARARVAEKAAAETRVVSMGIGPIVRSFPTR